MIALSIIGLGFWLFGTPKLFEIPQLLEADSIRIFHLVENVNLSAETQIIASLLIWAAIGRILFNLVIGTCDIVFHKRITGKPFDWKGMINIAIVNSLLFYYSFLFIFTTPYMNDFMTFYDGLLQEVPTIIALNGVVAVIIACIIGDLCFYISHRIAHNWRILWNLGHINHHRHQNLTQLHYASDPNVFFLMAGKGISLMLLPLFSKLLATDLSQMGWVLVAVIIIDTITDPSHSITLYHIEKKSRVLKFMRWFIVTVGVHYTHHSKDPKHNKKTGCNFGARITLWDRLFGTYVEPEDYIPETGLFGKTVDYCNNPIRYVLLPYVRFYKELSLNHIKHWPKILFGSVFYSPPVKAKMSH